MPHHAHTTHIQHIQASSYSNLPASLPSSLGAHPLPTGTPPSPSSCSLWRNSHLSFVMKYLRVHSTFSYLSYDFLPRTSSSNYTHVLTWTTFAANGGRIFIFPRRIYITTTVLVVRTFLYVLSSSWHHHQLTDNFYSFVLWIFFHLNGALLVSRDISVCQLFALSSFSCTVA